VKPANPAKDKVRAMRELLLSDEYAEQKRAVTVYAGADHPLLLDSKAFAEATESLHGRTRVYFAEDARTLLKNGNQTKPKQVPGTPWWVITNTNTGRKCSMIEHIMQSMQFPAELIEKVCGTI
jgi:negative modulator of initiation of replication